MFKIIFRTLVLNSYCRFLSKITEIDNYENKHVNFFCNYFDLKFFYKSYIFSKINFIENVAISTLWSLVRLDGKENSTTNSALVALSKFKKTNFKCSHFPTLVINFNFINYIRQI